jgi:hypothetical protein
MNVKKLKEAMEVLKKEAGVGLVASDIYSSKDLQSIIGYNSSPEACALFGKITEYLKKALEGTGFPGLRNYYLLDLVDHKTLIAIPLGDYQWGLLIDTREVPLGMFLSIILPKITNAFEEALTAN